MKDQKIKVPYQINRDSGLSYSARKVYCALRYFHVLACHRGGHLLKTHSEIAGAAGIKNAKTVAKAVLELSTAGYIEVKEHGYWDEDSQMVRRGTNEYFLLPISGYEKDYVWVPVKLLKAPISPAAFAVLLFLLRKQGANKRSWPSLRRGFQQIVQKNGKAMPRKTICDALEQLKRCLMLIICHCRKINRVFSMNSYMLTIWGDWTPAQAERNTVSQNTAATPSSDHCSDGGGYIFGGLPVRTKITNDFYLEEEEKGVWQFGNLHRNWPDFSGFSPSDAAGFTFLLSLVEEQLGDNLPSGRNRSAAHPRI